MNTLKFNDADLKANREGYLSDAQQKRLDADLEMIQRYSRYMLWSFGVVFALMIIVAVIAAVGEMGGDMSRLFSQSSLTGFAIMAAILGGMFLLIGRGYWWSMRGLTKGTIRTAEGTAEVVSTFTTVRGMRVPLNRLRVRKNWYSRLTFHFADAQSLRYFKNGTRYRIYYLPYAMPQALSAEEIEPEKAKR